MKKILIVLVLLALSTLPALANLRPVPEPRGTVPQNGVVRLYLPYIKR